MIDYVDQRSDRIGSSSRESRDDRNFIPYPFVRFTELLGEQMVDSRVCQVLLGGIVLEFLQIDIPSRLELTAAGAEGGKQRLRIPIAVREC